MLKKIVCCLFFVTAHNAELFNINFQEAGNKIKVGIGAEKSAEIEILKNRLQEFEKQQEEFWKTYHFKVDSIKLQIKKCEDEVSRASLSAKGFVEKKLLMLREVKQAISGLKTTWKETISVLQNHVEYLETYSRDPHFKQLSLEKKSFYTLNDLAQLGETILAQEDKLSALITDKNQRQLNLDHRKKRVTTLEKEYTLTLQKQQEFAANEKVAEEYASFQLQEAGELIDLHLEALTFEKELARVYVQEEETAIGLKVSQIEIEQKKLEVLRKKQEVLTHVALKVDDTDLQEAQRKEEAAKHAYVQTVERFSNSIEELLEKKDKNYLDLQKLQNHYKALFPNLMSIVDWAIIPTTSGELEAMIEIGLLQEVGALCDRKIEQYHAQIDLEKTTYVQQQWDTAIVNAWYKIKNQLFQSNKELEKELEKFQDSAKELSQEKMVFEDKRRAAVAKLNIHNKHLSNIHEFNSLIEKNKNKLVTGHDNTIQEKLHVIEAALTQEIDITGKLIEYYSQIIVAANRTIQKNHVMVQELQKFSLWHRSGRAISTSGIKNIIPDLKMFIVDLYLLAQGYAAVLTDQDIVRMIFKETLTVSNIGWLLFKLVLILITLFVFYRIVPSWINFFENANKEYRGTYIISLAIGFMLRFIRQYSIGLTIWMCGYAIFGYGVILDFSSVLFFLCSIFYFLYLVRSLVYMFDIFVKEYNYPFCSEGASYRLSIFLYWFLSVTVFIFFFRESFILATYKRSELPDILLAFYSGFVRILLLLLVRREDMVALLPIKTSWGLKTARFIEKYYYGLLSIAIVVMVLMDPHIGGYNNLVHYVVWGIAGTFFTAKIVLFIYAFLRRTSAVLFFSENNDVLEERFPFARSCYAFTILGLFTTFLVVGTLAIAWIWGKPISLSSLSHFLTTERILIGSGSTLQKLSLVDVLKMFMYIPFAFFVAFIIDRFIINRFFSVLYVSPGVQNAISTISYYIVVITVIIISLLSEGLGYIIAIAIAPIVLSAAWAFREIFNDFVAYFVILIQRPIKVGDYIKIDEETCGVVRNITPRTVVLRRKRGFCIIIPNSRILRDTVTNWDYNLNYISCPDVKVVIAFKENPQEVINLLLKTVVTVPSVLKTPPPVIRLDEFTEMGFTLLIRVFTGPEKTLLQWDIASDVRLVVVKTLHENNIMFGAPVRFVQQTDVYNPVVTSRGD